MKDNKNWYEVYKQVRKPIAPPEKVERSKKEKQKNKKWDWRKNDE